jgi:NAD(P)-dependent dehydrogenase (short-subunit alcohol dehydrogenase family)
MPMPEEKTSIFNRPYKALLLGATGTIGSAFVDAFQADSNCTHVEAVARSFSEFDLTNTESIERQAEICRSNGPFQILVDATGALTIDGLRPEKSLASLESENLLTNFQINAIGPILALRNSTKKSVGRLSKKNAVERMNTRVSLTVIMPEIIRQ